MLFKLLPVPEIKTAVLIFLKPVNFSIKFNFIFSCCYFSNNIRFKFFCKKFFNFVFKFFDFIIKQKPTPQLNVFNISLSSILLCFNHLKIFFVLILFKSTCQQQVHLE